MIMNKLNIPNIKPVIPIPKAVKKAEIYLKSVYPKIYNAISGFRNAKYISEIELDKIQIHAEINHVDWLVIRPLILMFIDCKGPYDEPEEIKEKKLRTCHQRPKEKILKRIGVNLELAEPDRKRRFSTAAGADTNPAD